jgi:hypothetical protein
MRRLPSPARPIGECRNSREPAGQGIPYDSAEAWSYFRWGRHEYAEVMGAPPARLELASL